MYDHDRSVIKRTLCWLQWPIIVVLACMLASCDDPQVYGSVGVSSGFGGYGYNSGPRMRGSISVGGRIY